jgi:hypothetical protein
MTDQDIELAFIRIMANRGTILSAPGMSAADRRERIRTAIFSQGLENAIFGKGPETFAQAFQRCYGVRLERRIYTRTMPRDCEGRPAGPDDRDEVSDDWA